MSRDSLNINVFGKETYFNDDVTIWGNTNLAGKVTSTATSNTDSSTTLVTKGYVDKSTLHINVKDFGAKGDGVTDDYVSITAAITAAAGQVLIFPKGVYRTSQQIFFKESNSIIRGEGDVTIKNMDGIDGRVGCAAVGNPYTVSEAYSGAWKNYPPTSNVIVENIKFDYNRERWFNDIARPDVADRWNSCGLSIANAQYVTIKNCRVTDGKRQSIEITCPTAKYDYPDDSDDARPGTLIEMINMPSHPVDVNGDAIFCAQFITIDNCIAEGSGDDVIATHWVSNVLIKNSLFQYTSGKGSSSNTNCIEIDDGSRNITVDNCTAYNGMGGIEVKGHPPQPSPYNIVISNTRIINCAASFETHHTDWEERVDGKLGNAWNQLLNAWYDVDGSGNVTAKNWTGTETVADGTETEFYYTWNDSDVTNDNQIGVYVNTTLQTSGYTVQRSSKKVTFATAPNNNKVIRIDRITPYSNTGFFSWNFPNDDITSSSDIQVFLDDTNGTEVEVTSGITIDFASKGVTFSTPPQNTRVRIRRRFFRLSPGTEFECYTYNGESPLARGLTYSNIQIIAPQSRWSQGSGGAKNYLGTNRAFEIGAYQEVNLQNFYISDGKNDSGAFVDGYRPTQGIVYFRASDDSFYCARHGYRIGEPIKLIDVQPDDGSTGLLSDDKNAYWVKEVVNENRFKLTTEWRKVSIDYENGDDYDPAGATTVPVLANGTAMLNYLGSGMFHIRDGVKSLSIDGVSIEGFGRIEGTYDSDRVMAQQAINIVSSTRGALFVNNYRSNDGPIKVVDGTGSWQYTGHISNVYAYQSNGSTINVQPIDSTNKNLSFSNITIVGYPAGRKWATNGPCIDVISERPTSAYSNSAGAGSMMTNKTTGQILTKVSDRSDNNFLNLTACAWVHFSGSQSVGTNIALKSENNVKQVDKTASGTYTVILEDYLTFNNNNDILVFGSQPSGPAYCALPTVDTNGNCSFEVTTFNVSGTANNPSSIRVLVYGRPL